MYCTSICRQGNPSCIVNSPSSHAELTSLTSGIDERRKKNRERLCSLLCPAGVEGGSLLLPAGVTRPRLPLDKAGSTASWNLLPSHFLSSWYMKLIGLTPCEAIRPHRRTTYDVDGTDGPCGVVFKTGIDTNSRRIIAVTPLCFVLILVIVHLGQS